MDVSDTDLCFEKTRGSDVFAEGSVRKRWAIEELLPMGIVFGGITVDGLVDAAVDGELGLGIPFKPERMDGDRSRDGLLVDARGNVFSVDGNRFDERSVYRVNLHSPRAEQDKCLSNSKPQPTPPAKGLDSTGDADGGHSKKRFAGLFSPSGTWMQPWGAG